MDVVLASNNAGKVVELNAFFQDGDVSFVPQSAYRLDSVEETGSTFVENAIIKARYAAQKTGKPALADDSGIEIDALGGAPGVISARYGGEHGNDALNIKKVLAELENTPESERTARFHCVLALMRGPNDPNPIISQGIWEGRILFAPRGEKGFGYDPIFWVPTHRCSSAELDAEIKNSISHRARAIDELKKKWFGDVVSV